jgi:hypothetical protein
LIPKINAVATDLGSTNGNIDLLWLGNNQVRVGTKLMLSF